MSAKSGPAPHATGAAHWVGWPLERVLFAMAGTVTLLTVVLAVVVSPWWLALTAFAGVNLWLYVLLGDCTASVVLRRVFHLQRGGTR